jgi:non-ribosomal peptide synthase protein (TIGR01720 family)
VAVLIYTSGSTAEPKGVMISHRNQFHIAQAARHVLGQSQSNRILISQSPNLGAAINAGVIYTAYTGVPLTRLSPEHISARPARWLETLSRTRSTISFASNFLFDLCVRVITPEQLQSLDLSSVRLIWNGGEAVRADTVARFEAYFAPCGLRPGVVRPRYGITEAGTIMISAPGSPLAVRTFDRSRLVEGEAVELAPGAESGRVLVGLDGPAPGTRLEIVDPRERIRCGPGRVGEIWVSTPSVARGYWNRPEETTAAFDAHLSETGEGPFFRTGDLGFLLDDELFITGRLKEVIIIRGRNLYPVDVEASLQHCHPALESRAAAAFALNVGEDERLAIVHEVDPAEISANGMAIITAIRQTILRHHGVPAHVVAFVPPESIPRAGQWKIGRTECRARFLAGTLTVLLEDTLDTSADQRHAPFVAPRSRTEQALAAIWEQVLGVAPVGVHDEFADLGGDSLLRMQVLLAAEEAGLDLRVEDVHEHGTIADLSAAVEMRTSAGIVSRGPRIGWAPLLPRQLSLLRQGDAARSWSVNLNVFTASVLRPTRLDGAILSRALQQLLFHHDALRLRCTPIANGWMAEYSGYTPPGLLDIVDLPSLPESEQQPRVEDAMCSLRDGLDVQRGPLLRASLIHRGDDPDLVLVAAHHLVTDAYSVSIVARDLDALYRRLEAGDEPRLPRPTAGVDEWEEGARSFAESVEAGAEADYWRELATRPMTGIDTDFSPFTGRAGRERVVWAHLGEGATNDLRRLLREGLSIPDLLHTALARALSRQVGERTVRFWTVSHGRGSRLPAVDLSRTVGFLVRGYPVTLSVPDTEDEVAAARAVREQLQQIPHEGMGYEILANYSPDRQLSQLLAGLAPPVRLNYVGDLDRMYAGLTVLQRADGWDTLAQKVTRQSEIGPWSRQVDVVARIKHGDLSLAISYRSHAYFRSSIELFAGYMIETLGRLAGGAT